MTGRYTSSMATSAHGPFYTMIETFVVHTAARHSLRSNKLLREMYLRDPSTPPLRTS